MQLIKYGKPSPYFSLRACAPYLWMRAFENHRYTNIGTYSLNIKDHSHGGLKSDVRVELMAQPPKPEHILRTCVKTELFTYK